MTRPVPTTHEAAVVGKFPYKQMHAERARAHEKFRDKPAGSMEMKEWNHKIWLAVLAEEFGEIALALNEHNLGNIDDSELQDHLSEELVQLGAMAAAWLDAIFHEEMETL